MNIPETTSITVEVTVNAHVAKVWNLWTEPKHIIHWNNASDDWHSPYAENDLREEGRFNYRMEARDGSMGFDFTGQYNRVDLNKRIDYTLDDGREVHILFIPDGNMTVVKETFEAEQINSYDLQRTGWQAILDNFKNYVESAARFEVLHFEILINADAGTVYRAMLEDKNWREWTALFNPASHFRGSWEKGSRILFIGTDNAGKIGGMISRIRENIPEQFVSIEHLGVLQGDKEITTGPEVEGWAGALENYTFTEDNGKTLLSVDADANYEFMSFFNETWPRALDKLKEICERQIRTP